MRPWAWVRRVLALVVTVIFVLGVLVAPAFAAGKSFSSPKPSAPSSSRSFSSPKPSTPAPSRSYSTPKSTTPSAPKSYSSPAPKTTTPSAPKSYSTPSSPSYSGSDRSYSSPSRSFSSPKPSTSTPKVNPNYPPPPTYDTGTTRYPTQPPVIIYGPSTYTPTYWHDYYWGMPWYWRAWHRPTYYADSSTWAFNWWPIIIVGGIGIWILLGVISAYTTRRRRF